MVASPQVTITSGINPGVIYQFRVLATNEIGNSNFSDTVSFIAAEVPGTPRSVAKVSADASQITLSWLEPLVNGDSPVINYRVY